jgi:hypothetical protein
LNALRGERVAKQNHIALRAAAFEGAQDDREIRTVVSSVNSFRPRQHEDRALSYCKSR